jgi:ParB family chromosome partitioning protein
MGWNRKPLEKSKRQNRPSKAKAGERNPPTGSTAVKQILVEDIKMIGNRRALLPDKLESLKASILSIGLRTPITVRQFTKDDEGESKTVIALVAGHYRLAVYKELGVKRIPAFVMKGSKTDARFWHLMENLYRAELTALQAAEHLAELIDLVLTEKGGQVGHPGGKQPHDKGISRAAKQLGFSRQYVRRCLEIAALSSEAKEKVIEVGLDKVQSALLEIAKEETNRQLAKIDEITATAHVGKEPDDTEQDEDQAEDEEEEEPDAGVSDEVTPSPPLAPDEPEDEQDNDAGDRNRQKRKSEPQLFNALKKAWEEASRKVRKRFLIEIVKMDPDQVDADVLAD